MDAREAQMLLPREGAPRPALRGISTSQTTERHGAPSSAGTPGHDAPGTGLSRPVQEHLGRELRTTYNAEGQDKPAYLGDPVLPLEFEVLLERLDVSERQKIRHIAHSQGIKAVERALRELLPGSTDAIIP